MGKRLNSALKGFSGLVKSLTAIATEEERDAMVNEVKAKAFSDSAQTQREDAARARLIALRLNELLAAPSADNVPAIPDGINIPNGTTNILPNGAMND